MTKISLGILSKINQIVFFGAKIQSFFFLLIIRLCIRFSNSVFSCIFCGNPLICHDFYFEDCTCLEHQKIAKEKKSVLDKSILQRKYFHVLYRVSYLRTEVSFCLSLSKGICFVWFSTKVDNSMAKYIALKIGQDVIKRLKKRTTSKLKESKS